MNMTSTPRTPYSPLPHSQVGGGDRAATVRAVDGDRAEAHEHQRQHQHQPVKIAPAASESFSQALAMNFAEE